MTALDIFKIVQFDAILGPEITSERLNQDRQWGPDHDDRRSMAEWLDDEMIGRFVGRALKCAYIDDDTARDSYESNMIKIAALAIAAVKSSRRNRVPHGCIDTRPTR